MAVEIICNHGVSSRLGRDPRLDLKAKLCSEPFRIPNLKTIYKNWPDAINPSYPELRVALEERIDRCVLSKRGISVKS